MIDLRLLYDYLAEAEGRTWTAEDSAYIRDKFRQVETLAGQVIEKRTSELRGGGIVGFIREVLEK